eukprot:275698_1
MDLSLPTLEKQADTEDIDIKQTPDNNDTTTTTHWIDRTTSQDILNNQHRIKMYKPKYKLTLWDIREVYDCRVRLHNGRHELMFTIEIANAPNTKIEVCKNDINGSTVTRGDIFVRFFKNEYNVDNTHQLENFLLSKLKDKNIELQSETDKSSNFANIPSLQPQTIKPIDNNNNNNNNNNASLQILSIKEITPNINTNNNRKRSFGSIININANNKYGNPFINTSQNNENNNNNNN